MDGEKAMTALDLQKGRDLNHDINNLTAILKELENGRVPMGCLDGSAHPGLTVDKVVALHKRICKTVTPVVRKWLAEAEAEFKNL